MTRPLAASLAVILALYAGIAIEANWTRANFAAVYGGQE